MGEPKAIYGQIGKAVVVIMLLTVLDKILALVKEMLIAYHFGLSPSLDAFNVAFAIPTTIILYFTAAFSMAFTPLYLEWSNDLSPQEADDHARSIFYYSAVFFAALALIGSFLSYVIFPVLGYGLGPREKELGGSIERLLMFLLVLDGGGIFLASLLFAQKRFFSLYFSRIFVNATIVVFVAVGFHYGIYALVWGVLLGTFFKFTYMAGGLHHAGFHFFGKLKFDRQKFSSLMWLALPLLGSELIANSNMLIDTVMVTQLPPGSVSTLRYAYRINDLPIQIVIMSISRAIFPFISSQAIEKDYEGLRWVFKHSVTLLGLITLPLISLIALFSHDVVAILLERGAFDSFATQQTAETLVCYGVGLFFASYAFVNGAFFSALKDTKPLLYLGFLSMLLNIAFNFIFMRFMGVKGVALSTSATLAIVCTIFSIMLKNRLKIESLSDTLLNLLRISIASACMFLFGLLCEHYIQIPQINRVINLSIKAAPVIGCYALLLWVMKIKGPESGWRSLGKVFARSGKQEA